MGSYPSPRTATRFCDRRPPALQYGLSEFAVTLSRNQSSRPLALVVDALRHRS